MLMYFGRNGYFPDNAAARRGASGCQSGHCANFVAKEQRLHRSSLDFLLSLD
jgi:hypothetical protein